MPYRTSGFEIKAPSIIQAKAAKLDAWHLVSLTGIFFMIGLFLGSYICHRDFTFASPQVFFVGYS